jgi:hypothetical protein
VSRRVAAVCAALCLAAAVGLHAAGDRWFPPSSADVPGLLYVRSPEVARRIVLGFDAMASDVYWIRALQAFGRERLSPPSHTRTYALLYPLLDLTTTLDPYFSIAYRFGAIFLGEPYPGGPDRPDLAIALLNKALEKQPQKWQYMQDLGFVYYWHLQDYGSAAGWFERASQQPGAPNWLRPLAAVTLTKGGQRASARELFTELAQADEAWLRTSAQRRLSQLDTLDIIDAVQARINRFTATHPAQQVTWQALMAAGLIRGVPADTTGTPLVIGPDGRVTIARTSSLWPLPADQPGPR